MDMTATCQRPGVWPSTQQEKAMSTMQQKREKVKPVSGVARWIRPLIPGKTMGRLRITNAKGQASEYDVAAFMNGDVVTGYGLAKDDDEIYSVGAGPWGWTCDCGDSQFRNRECKHVKGLRAALERAGITLPAPSKPAPIVCEFDDP